MIAHVYILQYNVKHIVLFPEVWTDNKQYMQTICLDLSHLYKKKTIAFMSSINKINWLCK